MEVMAAQVQASPGFWQELEFSLFWGGAGGREVVVDCGQFPSPACVSQFCSVPAVGGDACSQKEEQS